MPKKKATKGGEMPQTEQKRFHVPGVDACHTNAIPRDTSYDLVPCPSRTRFFVADEQEFKVVKKGNCP